MRSKCWINDPPKEWGRLRGRPGQTWLHTIEWDPPQQNIGPWVAKHSAKNRAFWRQVMEMATLQQGLAP